MQMYVCACIPHIKTEQARIHHIQNEARTHRCHQAVPLSFLHETLDSARLVVMALGFPGSSDTSGEGRSLGGGAMLNVSNMTLLGQHLSDWVDAPFNADRR